LWHFHDVEDRTRDATLGGCHPDARAPGAGDVLTSGNQDADSQWRICAWRDPCCTRDMSASRNIRLLTRAGAIASSLLGGCSAQAVPPSRSGHVSTKAVVFHDPYAANEGLARKLSDGAPDLLGQLVGDRLFVIDFRARGRFGFWSWACGEEAQQVARELGEHFSDERYGRVRCLQSYRNDIVCSQELGGDVRVTLRPPEAPRFVVAAIPLGSTINFMPRRCDRSE
jgi:hypothetical protein